MKYAVEMCSVDMIYISSFIKIGSGIQKLMGREHRQHGDRISLLQESRLKTTCCLLDILFRHLPGQTEETNDGSQDNRQRLCFSQMEKYSLF
jgi:hypothetical protein